MISDDGEWVYCDEPGCENRRKNHAWGAIKAEDWFNQRNGKTWCPEHHPEWVADWRARRQQRDNEDPDDGYMTPEGYDDSPDQGVHRYDGGGTFW